MAPSRTLLIAGAGIGGLTAALALARLGHRIILVERAPALSDIGAGLQLSPNATRILIALGLEKALSDRLVIPDGVSIRSARSDGEIAFMPLGRDMEFRYGAPYWILHRADLQAALSEAVREQPDIILKLGTRVDDFVPHAHGLTALLRDARGAAEERGVALIGADGVWSAIRTRLGGASPLRFRERTAWRATLPADALPGRMRTPTIRLWLGANAHFVVYPVRAGSLINLVAIVRDRWKEPGWSAPGKTDELLDRFPERSWNGFARDLLRQPDRWTKWALFDCEDAQFHGRGPVTLLGDAAHPMLPFLAQGAGMAIEDAAILARCLPLAADGPEPGLRQYEAMRGRRVERVRRAAEQNGRVYHMAGLPAIARNIAMRQLGGMRLRARYDWLYDWRAE